MSHSGCYNEHPRHRGKVEWTISRPIFDYEGDRAFQAAGSATHSEELGHVGRGKYVLGLFGQWGGLRRLRSKMSLVWARTPISPAFWGPSREMRRGSESTSGRSSDRGRGKGGYANGRRGSETSGRSDGGGGKGGHASGRRGSETSGLPERGGVKEGYAYGRRGSESSRGRERGLQVLREPERVYYRGDSRYAHVVGVDERTWDRKRMDV